MVMGPVIEVMLEHGHEQVVFVADAPSGLRAIIAVHSTALGPSLGGVRFWRYEHEDDGLVDALRLSEAMTLKAAAAGLHQGGGKTVVFCDDPDAPRSEELLRALGRAIHELGGRYLAAEDVGATQRDMDLIALETPWVTGVDPEHGGSGDPSTVTAFGVVCGMRAVARRLFGDRDLHGRSVVIQGVGHVGAHLARLLVASGADVKMADVNAERVGALAVEIGAVPVAVEDAIAEPCDIYAPCALGGALTIESIDRLQCRAVVGAANNQLLSADVDDALSERGVLYAPDFVVNAGGIINLAQEFTGYSRDRAIAATSRIEQTLTTVFELAEDRAIAPGRAAELMAREWIESNAVPGGRWEPGQPTAWTNGEPLRSVRPEH